GVGHRFVGLARERFGFCAFEVAVAKLLASESTHRLAEGLLLLAEGYHRPRSFRRRQPSGHLAVDGFGRNESYRPAGGSGPNRPMRMAARCRTTGGPEPLSRSSRLPTTAAARCAANFGFVAK